LTWGKQIAKAISALSSLLWVGLAGYFVYIMRDSLSAVLVRLTGVEAFGVKFSMSGGQAMAAAIEMASKNPAWAVAVPEADRQRALDRANRERRVLEGAEILWVDDRPSNNRNEARMLRSFGAMITFACTTDEAIRALTLAVQQSQPFHLILSDVGREIPVSDPKAGLTMVPRLRDERFFQPVILYVGQLKPETGPPPGVCGITNRPDQLLHLVLDALSRVREAK
jgi:CheY-like chemotaxis protein